MPWQCQQIQSQSLPATAMNLHPNWVQPAYRDQYVAVLGEKVCPSPPQILGCFFKTKPRINTLVCRGEPTGGSRRSHGPDATVAHCLDCHHHPPALQNPPEGQVGHVQVPPETCYILQRKQEVTLKGLPKAAEWCGHRRGGRPCAKVNWDGSSLQSWPQATHGPGPQLLMWYINL